MIFALYNWKASSYQDCCGADCKPGENACTQFIWRYMMHVRMSKAWRYSLSPGCRCGPCRNSKRACEDYESVQSKCQVNITHTYTHTQASCGGQRLTLQVSLCVVATEIPRRDWDLGSDSVPIKSECKSIGNGVRWRDGGLAGAEIDRLIRIRRGTYIWHIKWQRKSV